MKNLLLLILLSAGMCQAQLPTGCAVKGITTGFPVSTIPWPQPSNPEQSSWTNTFRWQGTILNPDLDDNFFYQNVWLRDQNSSQIVGPRLFAAPWNSIATELQWIYQQRGEYAAEFGWELLHYNLGLDRDGFQVGVENPVVVLYNRFRSLVRVFAMAREATVGNKVEFELSLNGGSTPLVLNANRSYSEAIAYPESVSQQIVSSVAPFVLGDRWHYADFPVDFDPCTCNRPSNLNFKMRTIQQSDINLTATTTGTITPITQNGSARPKGNFMTSLNKAGSTISGATQLFKDIDSWGSANNIPAVNVFKDLDFLKTGLDFIPIAGTAFNVFSKLFMGDGTQAGPQMVQVMPMAINTTTTTTGTLVSEIPFDSRTIKLPGSAGSVVNNESYPYYNETLGLFTLLQKPIVGLTSEPRWCLESPSTDFPPPDNFEPYICGQWYHAYLTEPLQFAVNPAAQVRVEQIYYSIIDEAGTHSQGFTDARFINLTAFMFTDMTIPQPKYLKVMVNLSRQDAYAISNPDKVQNILLIQTYPITLVGKTIWPDLYTISTLTSATPAQISAACATSRYQAMTPAVRIEDEEDAPIDFAQEVPTEALLYPNPAADFVTVKLPEGTPSDIRITITDLQGRMQSDNRYSVPSSDNPEALVDVSRLAAGNYYVRLHLPAGVVVRQLRINR